MWCAIALDIRLMPAKRDKFILMLVGWSIFDPAANVLVDPSRVLRWSYRQSANDAMVCSANSWSVYEIRAQAGSGSLEACG